MTTKVFVTLMSSGTPVHLSTGVPLFNHKERLRGCEVHTRTYDTGGFDHELMVPGLAPRVPGWCNFTTYIPPGHPHTGVVLSNLDQGSPVEFSHLSSTNVWWQEDKAGPFVIMDAWTRRLLRVSPVPRELQCGFWYGIVETYRNVEKNKGKFVPGDLTTWFPKGGTAHWSKHRVWLAIHPAPFHQGARVNWAFYGKRAVVFDPSAPPGSLEAEVIEDEQPLALAAYCV